MITDAQRRAIFAWGRDHGMSIAKLRDMTPSGSISRLSKDQASRLLDSLNCEQPSRPKRRKRRPKNVYAMASDEQRQKIVALRMDLGWSAEGLDGWLSKRHFMDRRPMNKIDSSRDAILVIELLKLVIDRTNNPQERQRSAESVSAA